MESPHRNIPQIIDSHHHLWRYECSAYPWIEPESMSILARDYTLNDLALEATSQGVVGTVAVQARQTLDETDRLLDIAKHNPFCLGVVGWVPLQKSDVAQVIDRYRHDPHMLGMRHVIQDEPDGFMMDAAFCNGVARLNEAGLTYDLLIFGRQLPEAIRFVDRFPELTIILDHAAKPEIKRGVFDQAWAHNICDLARRPNVWCKLSGLATEVRDDTWNPDTLQPYADCVIEAFGADRIMFGSDWPVCLLRSGYARWLKTTHALVAGLSPDEQHKFFCNNAARAYGTDRVSNDKDRAL